MPTVAVPVRNARAGNAGAVVLDPLPTSTPDQDAIVWREELRPQEPFQQVLLKFLTPPTHALNFSCDGEALVALPAEAALSSVAEDEDGVRQQTWHTLQLPREQKGGAVCELTSLSDFDLADARFSSLAGRLESLVWYDDYDARPRFLPKFQTREEGCDRGMCIGLRPRKTSGEHKQELESAADVLRFRAAPRGGVASVTTELGGGMGVRIRLADGAEDCHWIDARTGGTQALRRVGSVQRGEWSRAEVRTRGETMHVVIDGKEVFRGVWQGSRMQIAAIVFAAEGEGVLFDDFVAGVYDTKEDERLAAEARAQEEARRVQEEMEMARRRTEWEEYRAQQYREQREREAAQQEQWAYVQHQRQLERQRQLELQRRLRRQRQLERQRVDRYFNGW